MKQLKLGIFVLSLTAILSACSTAGSSNNGKSNANQNSDNSVVESVVIDESGFLLKNPTDTSMLTKNCKDYIDAMREQEESLDDPFKYNPIEGSGYVTVEDYLDTGDVEGKNETVRNAVPNRSDRSEGVKLEFELPEGLTGEAKVLVSEDANFSSAIEFKAENNAAKAKNLFVNTKYYWKVVVGDEESDTRSFTTADYPRWIDARPMYNVRDNGGYMTYSGKRVKQGLVYRGGEITNRATGNDHLLTNTAASKEVFRDVMGMVGGIELDLRGTGDIYDGYNACGFAKNGDIEYVMHAIKSYEETFTRTRSEVKPIFEILANADEKPVYYHCFGGADRTGTIGFLLNGLLGVSYTDLVIDFELTSYSSINNEHIRNHMTGHQNQYDRWPKLIKQLQEDTTGGYKYDKNALLKDNIYNFLNKACSVETATLNKIISIMLED